MSVHRVGRLCVNARQCMLAGGLVILLLALLGGCAGKKLSVDELELDVASKASKQKSTIYLPADDGKPLTAAEKKALVSTGDFDRTVSGEDMRDVLLHFKYYVHQGRRTVERNIERGEPYLPYLREVLRQKKLPLELAYLPFIESGYNLQARSPTGALGMWQFVKGTGKYFGMKRDWWSDERYCPYQSTEAATDYLAKLNRMFKDWHMAITAYNAGEGRVSRAAKAAGTDNFFELRRRNERVPDKDRLTDENKQYLPRFLAVCKIMRNLDSLGFRQPDPRRAVQVAHLTAKPGTDLMGLSRNLGMSWGDLATLNPTFLRYITPPDREMEIHVPKGLEASAKEYLRKAGSGAGWQTYTVKKGDTLKRISARAGVPERELRRVNQVREPLKVGAKLRIPGSDGKAKGVASASSSAPPSGGGSKKSVAPAAARPSVSGRHVVKAGDTIFGLSRVWNVSPEEIRKVNNLKSNNLSIGQQLAIPGKATVKASAPAPEKSAHAKSAPAKAVIKKTGTYKVKAGDTLWGIARKLGMSPNELMGLNTMNKQSTIKPGDTLRVHVQ